METISTIAVVTQIEFYCKLVFGVTNFNWFE